MKEARIILPLSGNEGQSVEQVHSALKRKLALEFGGFTAVPAFGGWVNPKGELVEEAVYVYDIGCSDVPKRDADAASEALVRIAKWACEAADQVCVYVKDFSGEVSLVYAR